LLILNDTSKPSNLRVPPRKAARNVARQASRHMPIGYVFVQGSDAWTDLGSIREVAQMRI
jgi:hypothetical protein